MRLLNRTNAENRIFRKNRVGNKGHFDLLGLFLSMLLIGGPAAARFGAPFNLQSPDGNYRFKGYQKKAPDSTNALYYTLRYKGVPVVRESGLELQLDNHLSEEAMGLEVDRHKKWFDDLQVVKISRFTHDSLWNPVSGEEGQVRDFYNELDILFVKKDNPIYHIVLQVRAYNEGIAFRFYFPENEKGTYYRIMGENDEFCLPAGTKAWHASWAQGAYRLLDLKNWPDESERPLTLVLPNGWFACLAEAGMTDYARTKFKLSSVKPTTIVTSMYAPVDLISPFATPWRVIMMGERAGELLENNSLILNLNDPDKITDSHWIRPGKIMRVMTQTTKAAFDNIDFAAAHGLQYILFDWKWYGPAFSFSSDATKISIPDFDLPAIISYGKKKDIGVWLYVNQQALLAQSDSLFRIYHKWGIKGVKFGFVQVGSLRWTTWLESMIRKAAENKLMVDIHDDWRPTGEQRTWPNLMTAEGVRGNEEMPDATHNTILPFTRFIAGPADYTICYYDKRIKTTHAHQLALAAIFYSPVQTLYWYDKPSDYEHEPELAFWKSIPTTWDETKVLQGVPGQFVAIARRKGDQWFLGIITNDSARQLRLKFDFLPKNGRYTGSVYFDDDHLQSKTKVNIKKLNITSDTQLNIDLKPSGGEAIWLQPVDPEK